MAKQADDNILKPQINIAMQSTGIHIQRYHRVPIAPVTAKNIIPTLWCQRQELLVCFHWSFTSLPTIFQSYM